jgi:hypothetical protein
MDVPKKMASPHELIHRAFCSGMYECAHAGAEDPSVWCELLDELLQFNDEMLLHSKAREFSAEMTAVSAKRGGMGLASGLWHAMQMIDPYERIMAFDPDTDDYNEAGEKHPDCPSCVMGTEHYHRKANGRPVHAPGVDVPRETSGGSDAASS